MLTSCLEYIFPRTDYVNVNTGKIEVFTEPGQEHVAQKCFLDNVDAYTKEIDLLAGDDVPTTITDTIPDLWVAAYIPDGIWINDNAPNQLSAYGHELVRHYCYVSWECDYRWPDTPEWTGYVGELWFKAENLSLEYCP